MGAPGEARIPEDSGEQLAQEARRLLESASAHGVPARVMGGIAVKLRCPGQADALRRFGRRYEDVDVVSYGRQAKALRETFSELGYAEDSHVFVNSGGTRMVAFLPSSAAHVDVFLDDLQFCHTIPLKGRLEIDDVTLALADLLLQKLQIVEINRKDMVDVVALLLEHPVGSVDDQMINADRIAALTADDWGLWRTVTMNLGKIEHFVEFSEELGDEERKQLGKRLAELRARIEQRPKGLRWRMRSKVGDRVKWYSDVEDLREGEGVPSAVHDETGRGNAAT